MNRVLRWHLKFLAVGSATVAVTWLSGIGCPWKWLFHFPCPTCGVTRAMLAILWLDFDAYWEYNAMALPLILTVPVVIHWQKLRRQRGGRIALGISLGILAANLVYYCSRLA